MLSPAEDTSAEEAQNRRRTEVAGKARLIPPIMAGGIWITAAKVASQLSQIATFLLAARVLSPAEFGLFAFVSAVAVLLVVVAEGGWAEFIMKASDDEDCFDQIVTITLLSGGLCTAAGVIAAATFYLLTGSGPQSSLLALSSCWMLPAALTTAFDGTLVVRGYLRQRAIIRVVAELIGLGATIALLYFNGHASALVISKILCQIALLLASVCLVARLPRLRLTKSVFADVMEFSRQIVGNRLVVFAGSYSGTLVVGGFLGIADAGYYRAAERVVAAISEILGEPTRSLSWVVLRRAYRQPDASGPDVARASVRLLLVLLAVAAPMYLGLMQISDAVVRLALGDVWMPAASIIPFLCLRQLLLLPGYINEPLLSVVGQIKHRLPVTLFNVVVSLVVVVAFARFGLWQLALAQCFTAGLALATSIRLQSRFAGVNWLEILKGIVMLIAPPNLIMVVTVICIQRQDLFGQMPWLVTTAFQVGVGTVVYGSVLAVAVQLNRRQRWMPLG